MRKLIISTTLLFLISVILFAQGSGRPNTLRVRTDSNNALMISSATQTPPYTTTVFNNTTFKTDADGNLIVAGVSGGGTTGIVDVSTFGATGDGRQVFDGVTTNLSTTVTSATAGFDSARDTGKVIWGVVRVGGGDGNPSSLPLGTIVSVTNSTTIVVSVAAILTRTSVGLVWGTDDTDALQLAFADAFSNGDTSQKSNIYIPPGMYLVDELIADWRNDDSANDLPEIFGAGSQSSIFVYKPDFDFNTVLVGRGMLVASGATAPIKYWNFGITGNSFQFSSSLDWALALRSAGSSAINIEVHHIQSTFNTDSGIILNSCGQFEIKTRCIVENYTGFALAGAAIQTSSSVGILRNLLVYEFESNIIGNNSHMDVEGGNFADHFVANNICLTVSGGATAVFSGGTRFRHDLNVVDANTVVIIDAALVDDPIRIGAGATVKVSNSKFSGVTAGEWFVNSGTAYDLGGNSYLNAGATPVTTKAPYGFLVPVTFTLTPTCNAANEGQRNLISDSNTVIWGASVAGSGADNILAHCNGTAWTVLGI